MTSSPHLAPAKFGTVLGHAPGVVPVYSSDYASADAAQLPDRSAYRSYVDGIFTGYKWQCVELARRWLYLNRGYIFDGVGMAYDIFQLRSVRVVKDNSLLPLRSFANGAQHPPRADGTRRAPRLVDVLLRPEVMVFEPLWTLIPSNKAILSVLCNLFPHPHLLDSQYELTDQLRRSGYVAKPIAGRCGANISIVDGSNALVEATTGRFDRQHQIYQELFPLPRCRDESGEKRGGQSGGENCRSVPFPSMAATPAPVCASIRGW